MFLCHTSELTTNTILPLEQYKNKWTVSKTTSGYQLISNICPHQGSLLCEGASKHRLCMYHGWSFDVDGNPVGSGTTSIKNQKQLTAKPVYEWKNMLFTEPVNMPELDFLDFSSMQLDERRIDRIHTNYKNVMHVFLDVDHIPVLHAGVYDTIGVPSVDDIEWIYYENGSAQLTKLRNVNEAKAFMSTLPANILEQPYGSSWIALYPGTMIEWQPGALIITVTMPVDNNTTDVLICKYKDVNYSDENWKINSDVWELAWQQDAGQSRKLVEDPAEENLEEQKLHYLEWIKRNGKS